jgi:hypothetical protein
MKQKIQECNAKQLTVPILGLRHHRSVDKGMKNVFREFDEASKLANTLCPDSEMDEWFLKVFIELVTKKLQKHIGKTVGTPLKPGKARRTISDKISSGTRIEPNQIVKW